MHDWDCSELGTAFAFVDPDKVRLQVVENTGQSVHRILCTERERHSMREKRIFIGLSDRFAKPLSSEGFARVDFSGDNHRGGSRSPDHCGDYCSTQKSVHNSGDRIEICNLCVRTDSCFRQQRQSYNSGAMSSSTE